MESNWHRIQMNLFIDVSRQAMVERGRTDFFAGGNMFIYYSVEQARSIAAGGRYFRGPDAFFVQGVEAKREREIALRNGETPSSASSSSLQGDSPLDPFLPL